MKFFGASRLRIFAMAACALSTLAAGARAESRWATLKAIHCLENPTDRVTPGSCGELGAYQFRAATWHKYSQQPFSTALDRHASDQVAILHYEWLKQEIESRGLAATPYNIALAWNGGLGGMIRGDAPSAARDYAERAANLAADFDRRTAAR